MPAVDVPHRSIECTRKVLARANRGCALAGVRACPLVAGWMLVIYVCVGFISVSRAQTPPPNTPPQDASQGSKVPAQQIGRAQRLNSSHLGIKDDYLPNSVDRKS